MKGCVRATLWVALSVPAAAWGQGMGGPSSGAPSPTNGTSTSAPTTAPTTTVPAPPATPAPAAPAPLFWRGSAFILDQSTSLESLAPGLVQSAQSLRSYQLWASIRPRFALGRLFSLAVRQDATFEMFPDYGDTGSVGFFGDLWTDLSFRGTPTFAGIKPIFALRAQWPVSLATRARNVYVTTALVASLNRGIELPNNQSISLSLAFIGSHPWAGSTTGGNRIAPLTPDRNGCQLAEVAAGPDLNSRAPSVCGYGGAPANAAFGLTSVLSVGYQTPVNGLSFSVMGVMINSWLYELPPAYVVDRMGGVVQTQTSALDQRMRQATWLSFSADYDATKWLSLSIGYYSFRSVTNEDGTYGNPLYQPGGGTRLFFTSSFALDAIYEALRGSAAGGGGGGSARSVTMNDARPRRRFSPSEQARELRRQQMASGSMF
jgi:hypothetical protein